MTAPPGPPQLEDLLAQSSRIRPLARRLLSDEAEVDDILQETCLAFLARPPRAIEASGTWLRRVVRNLVLRSRQAKERRAKRERRAARPERISVTPDQVLQQAEMHRLLVEEVLRLDEPYRSTVLLRFFGEQTLAEIARQQNVPLDTAKTRLRRGIGQLRARLDHRCASREAWTVRIVALAGGTGALSSAGASASTAMGCAGGLASTVGIPSAAAMTNTLLGGFIVAQKTLLFVGFIGFIAIVGGFGLGRFTSPPDAEAVKARLDLQELRGSGARLEQDMARLKEENEQLAAAKASLEEKKSELERKASELDERLGELQAKSGEVAKPAARHGPRIAFQDMGELHDYLMGANWREMAEAAADMTSKLKEMHGSDSEPTKDAQIEFRLEEQKLIAITLKTESKLPSHISDGNGGFTHPIIHWNLLAERLELAGLPLSDAQVERISRLGAQYDAAWDDQNSGYGADTLLLEKVMNELELKRMLGEQLLGLLTHRQREVLVDPALHDTYPYDLCSPLMLLAGKIEPLVMRTREDVRASIEKVAGEGYGLSEEQTRAAAGAFDAWLPQVEPLLATPLASTAVHRVYFFTGLEALAAGRAQITLMKGIRASLPPDAPGHGKLLSSTRLYLPRLAATAKKRTR